MAEPTVIKSQRARSGNATVLDITPATAGWDFVHFIVRRLEAGETLPLKTEGEECAIVLLSGAADVSVDGGSRRPLGPRTSVFEAYPHAVYLPDGHTAVLQASEVTEVAECRAVQPRTRAPVRRAVRLRLRNPWRRQRHAPDR